MWGEHWACILDILGRGKFELSPRPKKQFDNFFQKTFITNRDTKMDFKQLCSQFILPYDKFKLMLHNFVRFCFLMKHTFSFSFKKKLM
jgi:hypothetical protein